MDKIDYNLYSRQIYTYGIDTMEKIINLKILIIGLRGLGIEIAKNLVLAGPKQLTIYDENLCTINDLSSNFFINESDILKKRRDIACLEKLSLLNPYIQLDICKDKNIFNVLNHYNIIVITEIQNYNYLFEINKYCRENNIAFIYTGIFGLSGFLFNDFGDKHIVTNKNGFDNYSYNIDYIIEKKEVYEIFINLDAGKSIELNDGDYVKFKEIKGLEELNDSEPKKIKITNSNSFTIEKKTDNEKCYISGGIVEEYKIPKEYKFYSLQDRFLIPYKDNENLIILDKSKKNENRLLHCAIISLHKYFEKHNELPKLNNLEESKEIVEIARDIYTNAINNDEEWIKNKKRKIKEKFIPFDESYILKVALWSRSEINPICTFLGGIAAQEVIKITGKYIPIQQWLRFDFFETIANLPDNCNRELLNSRYDDQIAIFGQDLQNKLSNLNIFMIGAGALGCEYLKNFALIGISTSDNKENKVTVTDNDNIELSNLSRQFLFRNSDIGKSKSLCACRESIKINKNFNCLNLNYLVNNSTTNIFNDDFWEKQNLIITAVDNLQARKFVDKKCTFYSLALIDAGTNGTNASSDIFYPGKTICLNDLPEPTETKIPLCTLKKFPTQINHCIHWAKEIFKELFEEGINELKTFINDKNKFISIFKSSLADNEFYLKIKKIKYFIRIFDNTNDSNIIEFAMFLFIYHFNLSIDLLLKEYPLDLKMEDGKLFWELGKKPPQRIEMNIQNSDILLYFKSFYHILSNIINYKGKIEEKELICILNKLINNNIKYSIEIDDKDNLGLILEQLEKHRDKINTIYPETFEKDNDDNYHINFILSLSNLRAESYGINKCNYLKAKEISGNIVPAIASTTAAITGLASLQIYTLLQTDNIQNMKCSAINLGISDYDIFCPEETRYITNKEKNEKSKEIKVIPCRHTVWDHIEIKGPGITIRELINLFKLKYNITIDFINSGSIVISSPLDDEEEDFDSTIEDLYSKETKVNIDSLKYIELKIISIDKNIKYSIPLVKYCLKEENKNHINNEEKISFKKIKKHSLL